jgi:arylsulfatase A-like enzyme
VHGVFKHLDDHVVGGKLKKSDVVMEELFDIVPKNTWITLTSDHGELFGEDGFFGHGPIHHEKVFEVPFIEGKIR